MAVQSAPPTDAACTVDCTSPAPICPKGCTMPPGPAPSQPWLSRAGHVARLPVDNSNHEEVPMPSMKNTQDRRAYTVEEVARLLGISRGSAYEAVRSGQIRSLTIGRRIVIPPSAVIELLGHEPPRRPPISQPDPSDDAR